MGWHCAAQVVKEKMGSMKAERDSLTAEMKQLHAELASQRDDSTEVCVAMQI